MSRTREVKDVIAVAVPAALDPEVPEQREHLLAHLGPLAERAIIGQYPRRPKALVIEEPEWLITRDPAEAEAFQPAHDCAACRTGQDQALAFLREYPDRYIALGNLTYTEHW